MKACCYQLKAPVHPEVRGRLTFQNKRWLMRKCWEQMVERAFAWLNRWRRLTIRYE